MAHGLGARLLGELGTRVGRLDKSPLPVPSRVEVAFVEILSCLTITEPRT